MEKQLVHLRHATDRNHWIRFYHRLSVRLHLFTGMRSLEQLFGNLTKVIDESNGGILFQWIVNVIDVHVALVEQMMEYIDRINRRLAQLFVAKYQIDPQVNILTDIVTLECLSMYADKFTCVLFRPRWQNNVS